MHRPAALGHDAQARRQFRVHVEQEPDAGLVHGSRAEQVDDDRPAAVIARSRHSRSLSDVSRTTSPVVLLNNGQLGKISKEQRAGEWDVWQTTLHNPDFSAFARNCGAFGVRVTDAAQLDAALAEAVAYDGPAMVEVMTDPDLI